MKLTSRKPANATPKRLDALSKLPLFYNLQGKRAVIAGGTPPAAWKAELLAACGANVQIYATELSEEMSDLLQRDAAAGTMTHHPQPWDLKCFDMAAIAIADAANDDEAKAFYCAAVAAGVPVNVVDRPDYGQFQFGSIVNRHPALVAISTDGAAPVLGQAIRRRIETLLPPHLGEWVQLSMTIRERVSKSLSFGMKRRAFWGGLADLAFQRPVAGNDKGKLLGWVTLIAENENTSAGRAT